MSGSLSLGAYAPLLLVLLTFHLGDCRLFLEDDRERSKAMTPSDQVQTLWVQSGNGTLKNNQSFFHNTAALASHQTTAQERTVFPAPQEGRKGPDEP